MFAVALAIPVAITLPGTALAGDVCGDATSTVRIGAVQGSGPAAALTGTQTVEGVVVGNYQSNTSVSTLRGFYLQDPIGDSNPSTSDAIFVFTGTALTSAAVGSVVRVTGTVSEFQNQTQISPSTVTACPSAGVPPIVAADISLPLTTLADFEAYEGMLVRFPQALTVTEHYQLGRFGQVTLAAGGRLFQGTQTNSPGAAAVSAEAANVLRSIVLDDESQGQNPDPIPWGRNGAPLSASNTLRGGDTVAGLEGVLTYTWAGNSASPNAWRVRSANALTSNPPQFVANNVRPTGSSVGGPIVAAGLNVLNYFNTFGNGACTYGVGGGATDCRGANNQTEFERQQAKTVASVLATGADVVSLNEIENDGYGPTSSLASLVNALNATAGAGTWAYVDADSRTGLTNAAGTDAIKVAMIYKPAKVTAFQVQVDTNPIHNRRPLAVTFTENATGARFTAVGNHFKSKGSCPAGSLDADQGDGQSCWNALRVAQANQLASWLTNVAVPAANDPDVVILGDLNSYAKEAPIAALATAGYADQVQRFVGANAYSYVFNGRWGTLDYALANATLASQIIGADELHSNADEPSVLDYNTEFKSAGQVGSLYASDLFRASDHDPVIVAFNLTPPPNSEVPSVAFGSPAPYVFVIVLLGLTTLTLLSARRRLSAPFSFPY